MMPPIILHVRCCLDCLFKPMQLGDEVECRVNPGGNASGEDNLSVVHYPHILKNIRCRSICPEFRLHACSCREYPTSSKSNGFLRLRSVRCPLTVCCEPA